MSAVSNLLKKAAAATESKPSKSTAAVVTAYGPLADKANVAKKQLKDAEAVYQALEGEVINHARKLYEQNYDSGEFTKSLNFEGSQTAGVQVTFMDKFSAIPIDSEDDLKKSLRTEFAANFEEKRTLTLSKTDDATIAFLMQKLGEEKFVEIFDIKVSLQPKADMDRKQFELPKAARSLLKQAKPSVKILGEKE